MGITSDEMASSTHRRTVPLEVRKAALEQYLKTFEKPFTVFVIEDAFGPAQIMDRADVLIVSEET